MNTSLDYVLLIEDDLKLAKTLSEALEEEDIHCCVAHQANAVQVAAAWQPGLIVLDGGFRPTEGVALLHELRRHKSTAELPVVILSGNTDRHVIDRLRAEGIADYWALHELGPERFARRVKRCFATYAGSAKVAARRAGERNAKRRESTTVSKQGSGFEEGLTLLAPTFAETHSSATGR